MSTDPTANPPEDESSWQPSDPTQPTFSPPTQPTSSTPPPSELPPATPPPPAPPPPPAYGASQVQPGQPYPTYGQQDPYPPPAPPYQSGMYAGSQEHPQGTVILVLGILSIALSFICGGFGAILGPIAWVMGHRALAEIDASGRAYTNRSAVKAGMICGIVGTVLLAIGLVLVAIWIIVAVGAATTGAR